MFSFKHDEIYTTPDEIDSFGNCSLNSSTIKCLTKHYNNYYFKEIPSSLTSIITTYTNELFGDINEFEIKYRKVRNEFKSNIYTIAINKGVECFYDAYDKGDYNCLYEFLVPRVI